MSGLLPRLLLYQVDDDIRGEGLPFWLFWLLLCVILLLLAFIFLRDKDLRRRLSAFLSGARRKMLRLRLEAKTRKEKKKKVELLKELGKLVWSEDISIPATEETCQRLIQLEEEQDRHQMQWHEVYSKIESLAKAQDEVRKHYDGLIEAQEAEKKPHDEKLALLKEKEKGTDQELQRVRRETSGAGNEADAGKKVRELENAKADLARERREVLSKVDAVIEKIRHIEAEKQDKLRQFEKEIRELEKNKEKIQEKIIEIRRHTEPLFENLGRAADEARPDHKDLSVFYFEMDRINQTIQDLAVKIEKLR